MTYGEYLDLESSVYELIQIAKNCGVIMERLYGHGAEEYKSNCEKLDQYQEAIFAKKREILAKLKGLVED